MEYSLKKGEVVCFDSSSGSQILYTVSGSLWLTRSPDSHDYIQKPGSRFLVNPKESIVLEALEDAGFTLVPANAKAPARLVITFNASIPHEAC